MKTSKKVNGKRISVSENTRLFFNYDFSGDGQYYLTEQGSRHYRNTFFSNFLRHNDECIEIIQEGNDAPRDGKTGGFVIVKFNENFNDKWGWYLEELKKEKERIEQYKSEKKRKIEALGDQKEMLKKVFLENPDFKSKINNRIDNYSSKKWRGWVKMKVAQKLTGESFELLTLSPADIRDIADTV